MVVIRLWHIDLIKFLPRSQLLAQWRELNSIYKKQDNHILINYCYAYDKQFLLEYTDRVISEFYNRGYNIKKYLNYDNYFNDGFYVEDFLGRYNEHNEEYLKICYWNLHEKYIRGQKDFSKQEFIKLQEYCFANIKDWKP